MKKIWRKNGMEKHIEVIGIDHGWSKMKTATHFYDRSKGNYNGTRIL